MWMWDVSISSYCCSRKKISEHDVRVQCVIFKNSSNSTCDRQRASSRCINKRQCTVTIACCNNKGTHKSINKHFCANHVLWTRVSLNGESEHSRSLLSGYLSWVGLSSMIDWCVIKFIWLLFLSPMNFFLIASTFWLDETRTSFGLLFIHFLP